MAEDRRSRGPRHDQNDESQYPPPPGEEEERSRTIAYHSRPQMASGAVTLPSIQDPRGGYPTQGGQGWDPRSSGSYGTSPSSSNGYPTEPSSSHQGSYSPAGSGGYAPPHGYLPPVQPAPQDARGRPSPYGAANAGYDFAYRPERGPPGQYPPDYGRVGQQVMQPSAPRQRTSIACKYCRRRKIRCSGYQNSPGGKCTNCIKMNQECVFQPVSNSTSTAFVPVSALQNGIPPGTQLFGAYGQPLSAPSQHGQPGGGPYSAGPPGYDQPLPSPTGSSYSYPEERGEPSSVAGMRRPRPPEEEHAMRLPPPTTFPDDNSRRRSPSSSSSPNHLAPYTSLAAQQTQPSGYDSRTPRPGAVRLDHPLFLRLREKKMGLPRGIDSAICSVVSAATLILPKNIFEREWGSDTQRREEQNERDQEDCVGMLLSNSPLARWHRAKDGVKGYMCLLFLVGWTAWAIRLEERRRLFGSGPPFFGWGRPKATPSASYCT
ncbi:fungal zn(2)-Cys(6) binuclear cluster domain-containing protein [Apiospora saccharicola]|uniref:Fungal zn(2)-Cys(6) binuclear cluster domain-containing protein n=1 Tax=Apiospora saccharicola TaxID=335842 RepID=A0ABR1V9F6_9PEZI